MKREEILPSEQHPWPGLPRLDEREILARRERVYLVLAGLFLGTLTMLNLLGITRFLDLSFHVFGVRVPMPLAVGVLPYPVTFLCTDFISELYGRKRANHLVFVGLLLNAWVVLFLWLGSVLPPEVPIDPATGLPPEGTHGRVFFELKHLTFGAVVASMFAYLAAQLVDVQLFHFWKGLTKGRHLWLRNNASTLVSQLVDTVAVILVTHFLASALPIDAGRDLWPQLLAFIGAGYVFKVAAALLDTAPFYLGVRWLTRYLRMPPAHGAEVAPPAELRVRPDSTSGDDERGTSGVSSER